MVDQVFLLQNQAKRFLNKQGEWTDGRDLGNLYKTRFYDEAVNQSFETGIKDHHMRIRLLECPTNNKGQPQIAPDQLPPADPEPVTEPVELDLVLDEA